MPSIVTHVRQKSHYNSAKYVENKNLHVYWLIQMLNGNRCFKQDTCEAKQHFFLQYVTMYRNIIKKIKLLLIKIYKKVTFISKFFTPARLI